MSHTIAVETFEDNRVILHVNGFTLDVIASNDGITAELFKGEVLQTELGFDWDEAHINA